jgi:hypothetical protein
MAFKAQKDTYAFERVGPDAVVRREIKAGAIVAEGLFSDEEATQPLKGDEVGGGETFKPYAHQQDKDGNVLDEHKPKVAPYEPPVKKGEVVTGQERDEQQNDASQRAFGGKTDTGHRPAMLEDSGEQPGAKSSEQTGPGKK